MKPHIFQAFSERPFLYLWLGEVFTQISINLFNFFLILLVYNLTHSNTAVAGIIISFTLPAILFGIIAGVYVDRWDKKKVLYMTNAIRAVLIFLLAFMYTNVTALFIISFLVSTATQFFIPAESPVIPRLVKGHLLLSANALFGLGIFGSMLVAYLISGPLILAIGDFYTLIFLGFLLLLGAFFVSLIRIPPKVELELKVEPDVKLEITHELTYALKIMAKTKVIYQTLLILAMTQVLTLIIAAIIPGYASDVLKMRVEEFPFLFIAPAALGTVLGAIILVNKFHGVRKDKLVNAGIIMVGLSLFILPYGSRIASREFVQTINMYLPQILAINNLHLLVFLAFVMGIANALVFVPSNTMLQEETTEALRGKAYGVLNTLVGVLSFLPILIVGSMSDLLGVVSVIVGIGVIVLLLGISRIMIK